MFQLYTKVNFAPMLVDEMMNNDECYSEGYFMLGLEGFLEARCSIQTGSCIWAIARAGIQEQKQAWAGESVMRMLRGR